MPIHHDACRNSAKFFPRNFFLEFFVRSTRSVFPDGQHAQHRMCLYTSEFIRNNAVILSLVLLTSWLQYLTSASPALMEFEQRRRQVFFPSSRYYTDIDIWMTLHIEPHAIFSKRTR